MSQATAVQEQQLAREVDLILTRVRAAGERLRAVRDLRARGAEGAEAGNEPRLWQRDPTCQGLTRQIDSLGLVLREQGRLGRLAQTFGLSLAELDLLQLCLVWDLEPALAAELGALHEPSPRPFVSDALARGLFGRGHRPCFDPAGAPARWEFVREAEAAPGEPTPLLLDPHVRMFLTTPQALDALLVPYASLLRREEPLAEWPVTEAVTALGSALRRQRPLRLFVRGAPGSGRRTFAAACVAQLKLRLLALDTSTLTDADFPRVYLHAQRQAALEGLALVWHGERAARSVAAGVPAVPVQIFAVSPEAVVEACEGFDDLMLELPALSLASRRALWRRHLSSAQLPDDALESLVVRYQVTPRDIVAITGSLPHEADPTREVRARCRERTEAALGDLGKLLPCPYTREDLVVPAPLLAGLEDFWFEAGDRARLFEGRDVHRLYGRGAGLVALFAGSSGTGKTMAAQVSARELGLDLVRVDLAALVSKYVGETAKNLRRLFQRAADLNAVLLFDEAEALFARRTDVRDAQDRHANADTDYLLQLVEDFRGVAILSTNQKQHIDGAFIRRLRHVFDFPRPGPDERRTLWLRVLAELDGEAPARLGSRLDALVAAVDFSGAQIKQATLSALFRARREGSALALSHLLHGVERELAKEGRGFSTQERERILRHVT